MNIEEHNEESSEHEWQAVRAGVQALTEVQSRIGPRFRRAEVRRRARRFLEGLLAPVERKNGWQLAEELGEHGPRGVQRLLGEADWDEDAVRDDLRSYVSESLGEENGLLVLDETGFIKKGKKSAGVARQYSGTAGRRENSQIGVFLLYACKAGAAFVDRELYLPEEWTADRVRCREAGIPDEVAFATKGELAQHMLARAFAAHMPAQWVVGDTVYGYDQMRSQGPRLYEWAWLALSGEHEAQTQGRGAWLLIRRNLSDPSKRAFYRVSGPASTTLAEAVRVAGGRWSIEEGLEEAKGEVGLDQYEVRGYRAWYRHITLALLAHAVLVVTRAQEKKRKTTSRASS